MRNNPTSRPCLLDVIMETGRRRALTGRIHPQRDQERGRSHILRTASPARRPNGASSSSTTSNDYKAKTS